jgi:hypothetical protein
MSLVVIYLLKKGLTLKSLTGTCYVCGAKLELGGTPDKGYRVKAHHRQLPKGIPVEQLGVPTPNCSGSDMPPLEQKLPGGISSVERVTTIRTISY